MSGDVVRSLPLEDWRRFVAEHPDGNVFHTPEMWRVFAESKGHRPQLWAVVEHGEVLALLLPVEITLLDGAARYFTTRSVVYGGPLCAAGPRGAEALALLVRTYRQEVSRAPLFTELRNVADTQEIQPVLQRGGFAYEDHLNYLIDLDRPAEKIFAAIGHRTRKNIRHGLNQGDVTIEEALTPEGIRSIYGLLRQTYSLARVPLAGLSLFEAAFDVLHPQGMVRFTLARVGGVPAAASIELLYKDLMYGWYGATDRAFAAQVPNELLTWRLLEWGAGCGYRMYDFGGAGKPGEEYGVRDFKAKFGGQLVNFGRNRLVHSRWRLAFCESVYEAARSLRRAGAL